MDFSSLLPETEERRLQKMKWFLDARFGMFIHWGTSAQLGHCVCPLVEEQIPVEEYEKLADTWKPDPDAFRNLARLAKKAGMRYMVLGSKHVEGFCLWDCKLTDYTAPKRGPGRDMVAEFVEAARAEDMRVGLYYPLTDWHHPDTVKCYSDRDARDRFVDYFHEQMRELMTNYGRIDLLWYDGSWPLWDAQLDNVKLNAMVRKLQPDIIMNDRSGMKMDFISHECHIIVDPPGQPWETCMTFNDYWGYTPIDTNYKTAWDIVKMLGQVAAGQGNLLMNVGPAPDGSLPEQCVNALLEVGEWLGEYGPSVYDVPDRLEGMPPLVTGQFTRKGNTAYFHCHRWPGTELAIGGFKTRVASVKQMGGPAVQFTQKARRLVLHGLPEKAPSPIATVFEIEFEDDDIVCGVPPFDIPLDDWKGWTKYLAQQES